MGAGRKHETPGSEIKDFITYSTASSKSISMYLFLLPRHLPWRIPIQAVSYITGEELEA